MHTRNSLLTTVLDREIEVPLTADVDEALGEVVVDDSAVLDGLAGTRINGSTGMGMGGRFTGT